MMRILLLIPALVVALACEPINGLEGTGPGGGENGGGVDPEDIPWEEDSDGTEIWEEAFAWEPCASYVDPDGIAWPVPGATRFFAGDYDVNLEAGTFSGKEYWLLVANEHWKDTGEDDCQVVWTIEGDIGEPGCNACDFSTTVVANMNQAQSDCPNGLQSLESDWEASYDVIRLGDGSATLRFLESGNEIGDGWWSGDRVAWISEPACMWF